MIILDTIIHETIWGGGKLATKIGKPHVKMGHLYSVYCREGVSNTILNGEYAGKTLNEIFPRLKYEFGMNEYMRFPLTIALTEACTDLSIQVHPNDEAAAELENFPRGKRESWYFIDAPASGSIVNGCAVKDKAEVQRYVVGDAYEKVINHLPVSQGDYVFVEPGTLHSISAGSLVYEIEEGADATYRFYDYDRIDDQGNKRELHTANAIECLDTSLVSTPRRYEEGKFITEKSYSTMKLENKQSYTNKEGGIVCLTVVDGEALVDGIRICSGMTCIMYPRERVVDCRIELGFVAKINEGR